MYLFQQNPFSVNKAKFIHIRPTTHHIYKAVKYEFFAQLQTIV